MRRRLSKRRGSAAVEMAVLLPFLMFLLVMGADWARALYYKIQVETCARAGALWAADYSRQTESGFTNVTDAARAASPNLKATDVTVSDPAVVSTVNSRTVYKVTVSYTYKPLMHFNFDKTKKGQMHEGGNVTLTRTVEMRELPALPN